MVPDGVGGAPAAGTEQQAKAPKKQITISQRTDFIQQGMLNSVDFENLLCQASAHRSRPIKQREQPNHITLGSGPRFQVRSRKQDVLSGLNKYTSRCQKK
jgi:hypothetical protein